MSWSKRGNKILTGSVDDNVKVWSPETYQSLHNLLGHQLGVISVQFAPVGNTACSSSLDSQIITWDIQSHQMLKSIDCGPVESWTVAYSPDGRFISTGTHSGNINTYLSETGEKDRTLETKGKFVMSVAYVSKYSSRVQMDYY